MEEARKKYGDSLAIYNTSIDKSVKDYIVGEVNKNLPFVVNQRQVVG